MDNLELEKKLKASRVPERDDDYWESFPRGVLARLRATPARRPAAESRWLPRLVWSGGMAVACLMIGFALGHWHGRAEKSDASALLQNGKMLQEVLTLFPNRVRAIVQDGHGIQLVLANEPDVPVSPPIYVRICDGAQCASLVTFSGQEIQVAGQKLTVLSDAQGGIILTGNQFVWSSDQPVRTESRLKIEARRLGPITL
jgi:hypothetical protein